MTLFVANLTYSTNEQELRGIFADFGQVESVKIITDRETGQSRGFGFVDMPDEEEAQRAMIALHGAEWQGRTLAVNEARPRAGEKRPVAGSRR